MPSGKRKKCIIQKQSAAVDKCCALMAAHCALPAPLSPLSLSFHLSLLLSLSLMRSTEGVEGCPKAEPCTSVNIYSNPHAMIAFGNQPPRRRRRDAGMDVACIDSKPAARGGRALSDEKKKTAATIGPL